MSIDTGLIHLYRLDADFKDIVGGNNLATVGGTLTHVTDSDHVAANFNPGEVQSADTVDLTGTFTISFWAKKGTPYSYFSNDYTSFFRWGTGSGAYLDFYLLNNKIRSNHMTSNGSVDQRGSSSVGSGWNHYAMTIDPGAGSKIIYLNGSAVSVTNGGFSGTFSSAQDIYLGNISNGNAAFRLNGNGKMDDVGIWNRVLSAAEISQVYNAGTSGISSLLIRVIDENLAHHYKLDGNANDSVGGSNGTNNGATISSTSASFDGSNDFIQIPSPTALSAAEWSISLRVKTSASSGREVIFGKWYAASHYATISIENDSNSLKLNYRGNNTGSVLTLNSSTAISDNQWHSIAVVKTSSHIRLYLDGAVVAAVAFSGTIESSSDIFLGKFAGALNGQGNDHFYSGLIDDVAIWSHPLKASEISAIHNAGTLGITSLLSAVLSMVLSNITGDVGSTLTFSSSIAFSSGRSSLSGTAYDWAWDSSPAGSAIGAFQSFPTNSSAAGWFDMSTAVVYHQMSSSVGTQFPNSGGSNSYINMSGSTALYHLDGNANDDSANSYNGTVSGAVVVDQALWMLDPGSGVKKQAYKFDGTDDVINTSATAANLGIDGNSDRSTSWWMRYDATSCNTDWVWSVGNNSTRQAWAVILLNNAPSTQIYVVVWDDNLVYTLPRNKQCGGWHHFVATYRGSTRTITLYVDGDAVMDHIVGANLATSNSANLNLGGRLNSTNNFFNGWMQEFAMFDEVLTPTDVSNIYTNQKNAIGNSTDKSSASYEIVAPVSYAPASISTSSMPNHYWFDGAHRLQTVYSASQVDLDGQVSGHTVMTWMKMARVDDAYVATWTNSGMSVFDIGNDDLDSSPYRRINGFNFRIDNATDDRLPDTTRKAFVKTSQSGYSSRNFLIPRIDEWNHLAFVYRDAPSGNGSRMDLYLNGQKHFDEILTAGDNHNYRMHLDDTDIILGGDFDNDYSNFSGSLAEFTVLTSSLSQEQVKLAYQRQSAFGFRKDTFEHFTSASNSWLDTTGLVAAYRLGEYSTAITGTALPNNGGSNSFINMSGSVGLWHLNGNLLDDSSNSNNGTISGNTVAVGSGIHLQNGSTRIEDAYYFDGSSDWIDTNVKPGTLGVDGGNARTFMIWYRSDLTDMTDYATLWSMGAGSNDQDFTAYARTGNRIQLNSWNGDLLYDMDDPGVGFEHDEWNHVAWIYDGAGNSTLVVNGVQRATQSKTLATSNANNIRIGSPVNGYGVGMRGYLQEFAIFNEALPVSDVSAIYNAQKNVFAMTDYSGNSRHITGSLQHFAVTGSGPVDGWSSFQFQPAANTDANRTAVKLHPKSKYDFDGRNGLSVSMWTKQSPGDSGGLQLPFYIAPWLNSNHAIYLQRPRGNSNYNYTNLEAHFGHYQYGRAEGGNFFLSSSLDQGDSDWMHVVGTVDSNKITRLYRNGDLYSEYTMSTQLDDMDDMVLFLGGNGGHHSQLDNQAFSGSIAEFALWNRAINPVEVRKIYDAQYSGSYGSSNTFARSLSSPSIAFTPDVAGTYTVRLTASGSSATVYATAVIEAAEEGGGGATGIRSQFRTVVQFTGSFGAAGISQELDAIATGSIVSGDFNSILSHLASSIQRLHGSDYQAGSINDFTQAVDGRWGRAPTPASAGAHDLGTSARPWRDLYFDNNSGYAMQLGTIQDVKLSHVTNAGLDVEVDLRRDVSSTNLAAKYLLETDTTDLKGTYNATNNGVTFSNDSTLGRSVGVFASGDYFDIPAGLATAITSGFSVSFWLNPSSLPGSGVASGLFTDHVNGSTYPSIQISLDENGKIVVAINSANTNSNKSANSAVAIPVGEWTQVTITYTSGQLKYYYNGVLDSAHTNVTGVPWNNTVAMRVGRNSTLSTHQFLGKMSDIQWWNDRVLTADETYELYSPAFEFRSTANLVLSSSNAVAVNTDQNPVLLASGSSSYSTFLTQFGAGQQSVIDAINSLADGSTRVKESVTISSNTTAVSFSSLSGLNSAPTSFEIFVNGALMREGSGQDYQASSSTALAFAFTLEAGDIVTGIKS